MWGGSKIGGQVTPANAPEREVAAEMLARVDLDGYTVVADKGFAGEKFESLMSEFGAILLRPDRKDEQPRFGGLGGSVNGSNRSSTRSKASSHSNAMVPIPCRGSSLALLNNCLRLRLAYGTTKTSATRGVA